jgi:5-methylcytosine-specific restriction endonuclease McrA
VKRTALRRTQPLSARRRCEQCDGTLTNAQRRFCSPECASTARRARVTVTCEVCGAAREVKRSHAWIKTCGGECAREATRRKMQAKDRTGAKNPNAKSGLRTGVRDRAGERRWYVAQRAVCDVCGGRGATIGVVLHHVVYRQHVRAEGGDCWDPRNAMNLCNSCHSSHHRRGRLIALWMLPASALEFAGELYGPGAYDYLRRRYSGDDPRVDALLNLPVRTR